MKHRIASPIVPILFLCACAALLAGPARGQTEPAAPVVPTLPPTLRAGMIGLDTSHVVAFTQILNAADAADDVSGCRVVAAFPEGTRDLEAGLSRVEGFTAQLRDMGVEIVDSIPALLEKVDVVLLETVDGRPHLEQAFPVFQARKPMFVDKPFAGSLEDAVAMFELARYYSAPVFSSSSLRYTENVAAIRDGVVGAVLGADVVGPCALEPTHPDLFWYGIHGVEMLYAVMGVGCEQVTRVHAADQDVVVGQWSGGRLGVFRGMRAGRPGYGGTVFGETGNHPTGPYGGYRPLVAEIVAFFRTNQPPVSAEETLELFAFMEAADESKRQGGAAVSVAETLAKARQAGVAKAKAMIEGQ